MNDLLHALPRCWLAASVAVGVACAACAAKPPARADTPVPQPADTPVPQPADTPVPQPADTPVPQLADAPVSETLPIPSDCALQIALPRTGYRIRLWQDGRITSGREGAESPVDPYDPLLRDAGPKRAFLSEQRKLWAQALSHAAPTEPPVSDGTMIPQGRVRLERIEFSLRTAGRVRTLSMMGDLRVAATLGPVQPAWEALERRLWPPAE